MKRPKILGAKAGACTVCEGPIYKILTSLGIMHQCGKCGALHR